MSLVCFDLLSTCRLGPPSGQFLIVFYDVGFDKIMLKTPFRRCKTVASRDFYHKIFDVFFDSVREPWFLLLFSVVASCCLVLRILLCRSGGVGPVGSVCVGFCDVYLLQSILKTGFKWRKSRPCADFCNKFFDVFL